MDGTIHLTCFSDKCIGMWRDMADYVLALAARHGAAAVNQVDTSPFGTVTVKNGKADFQGTMDDIALAVDAITAELEF